MDVESLPITLYSHSACSSNSVALFTVINIPLYHSMLVHPFRGKRIDTSNIKLQCTCFVSLFMCVGSSFIRGTFSYDWLPSGKLFLCGFAAKLIIRNTLTVSSPESTDDLYSNCLSFSCRKLAKQAVLENGHDNLIEMDVFPPVCHEGGYGDGYVLLSLLMVPAADAKPNTEPTKVLNLQTPHPIPGPPKQKASIPYWANRI